MREFSRRALLGSAAAAAAAAASTNAIAGERPPAGRAPKAPYRSMRDYIAALDAYGLVMRIPRVDQDAYEATALMYRMLGICTACAARPRLSSMKSRSTANG